MNRFYIAMCLALFVLSGGGCTNSPPPSTGFLSDYSQVKKDGDAMRYVSPKLKGYNGFIIEPVQMAAAKNLNAKERAEVANYFSETLSKDLTKRGYQMGVAPGPGVARIRVAITDIQKSKWYLNLHPASKLTGGASMEGEIVDSQSGEQMGAVIQAGKGNQFELDTFSKLDDVKDAINKWVETAGKRLDSLRQGT